MASNVRRNRHGPGEEESEDCVSQPRPPIRNASLCQGEPKVALVATTTADEQIAVEEAGSSSDSTTTAASSHHVEGNDKCKSTTICFVVEFTLRIVFCHPKQEKKDEDGANHDAHNDDARTNLSLLAGILGYAVTLLEIVNFILDFNALLKIFKEPGGIDASCVLLTGMLLAWAITYVGKERIRSGGGIYWAPFFANYDVYFKTTMTSNNANYYLDFLHLFLALVFTELAAFFFEDGAMAVAFLHHQELIEQPNSSSERVNVGLTFVKGIISGGIAIALVLAACCCNPSWYLESICCCCCCRRRRRRQDGSNTSAISTDDEESEEAQSSEEAITSDIGNFIRRYVLILLFSISCLVTGFYWLALVTDLNYLLFIKSSERIPNENPFWFDVAAYWVMASFFAANIIFYGKKGCCGGGSDPDGEDEPTVVDDA